MNFRQTWIWLFLAAGLSGFIYFVQMRRVKPPEGPTPLLPEIRATAVNAIQVRPGAPVQLAIRAERVEDGNWQLTEPLVYPALVSNVERLVSSLASLEAVTRIDPQELRGNSKADQEYGFAAPQASIIVQQGDYRAHLLIGNLTVPGDQVYLQIVGREGTFITDAGWLTNLPKSPNDWRDRALVHQDLNSFDRLAVTNNSRSFVLQRENDNIWRMIWPLSSARADNARIEDGLQKLQALRVESFVSEEKKQDTDAYGLSPAMLEVELVKGTNAGLLLQFGKAPPGATNQVYARVAGKPSLFTVRSEPLNPWRSTSVNDFRDPHLVTMVGVPEELSAQAEESFSVRRQTNDTWTVIPGNFPADPHFVQEWIALLSGMQVVQFVKDVVNPPDLPQFGLAAPIRQYALKYAPTNTPAGQNQTNCAITELSFGMMTNQPDKIYVRRADESSVYAVATNDFYRLPIRAWQLRDRKFWDFSPQDVAGLLIQQQGKTRELVHYGRHKWGFAAGSQGILNDLAVEETVSGLAGTSAVRWVERGEEGRERYGFSGTPYKITIKLKNGRSFEMQLGGEAPSKNQYAAVIVDGQWSVFELSWIIYRDVASYLSIP